MTAVQRGLRVLAASVALLGVFGCTGDAESKLPPPGTGGGGATSSEEAAKTTTAPPPLDSAAPK